MSKLNIKSFAILIFMIPILFVNSAGQNHALSSEQIKSRVPGPNSWNKTPSEDDIQRIMKELNTEQRNKLQTIVKTNIVQEMKDMIYDYYGKNTFDEPEWIRVKNFLDWIESNKDFLNRKFAMQKINLTEDHRKVFIGVFLGAHYVTDKMLGKTFDLSIYWSNDGPGYMDSRGIHVSNYDVIVGIDTGIHEAVHALSLVNDELSSRDYHRFRKSLPESITVFAQLKYALPAKYYDSIMNDFRSATRTGFRLDLPRDIFTKSRLSYEYADIVFAVTEYSKYSNSDNIINKWIIKASSDAKVSNTIEILLSNKIYNKFHDKKEKLNYINQKFLENPVFHDTIEEIIMELDNELANNLTGDAQKDYEIYKEKISSYDEFEFTRENIFYKNLKKYADPNIPPVPKGYI